MMWNRIIIWVINGSIVLFLLSRLFVVYDRYLFHKDDLSQDRVFNTICNNIEIPQKFKSMCGVAASGVFKPIWYRSIKDMVDSTVSDFFQLFSITYTWIISVMIILLITLWIVSSVISRLQMISGGVRSGGGTNNFVLPVAYSVNDMYSGPSGNLRRRSVTDAPIAVD